MSRTLFEAAKELSFMVQRTIDSSCTTDGSTTELYDTRLSAYPVDAFNGATIFFTSGTNSGASRIVTDFNNVYGYVKFSPLATAATATNDSFTITMPTVGRDKLWNAINRAIATLYEIEAEDTSLTTIAATEDYTLPAGVNNILKLEIAGQTAAPYYWVEHSKWTEVSGKLRIDNGFFPESGLTMRLTYLKNPADLTGDSSALPSLFDRNGYYMLLLWQAAYYVLRERLQRVEGGDNLLENQLNEAAAQVEAFSSRFVVPRKQRFVRKGGW